MKSVRTRGTAAVSVWLLGVLGCATVPPPPLDPTVAMNSGIVVVSVGMHLPKRYLSFGAQGADRVFMYRVDGDAAPYTPGPLIWSDQIIDGHAVFLEVPPGRYAIAGAVVNLQNASSSPMTPVGGGVSVGMSFTKVTPVTAYFPDELVRSLCVEVSGGGVATVGEVEVDLGSIRALDDAQRYAYRRVGPDHAGKVRSWLTGKHHYRATARRVDQSPARIDEVSQDVRSKLSEAGWQSLESSGPSTVAALEYVVPTPTSTTSARAGAPLVAVSLQVVDDVGSETSAEDVRSFEQVLALEFADAGFAVGKDPADLAIDIEVKELTSGTNSLLSLRDESAVLRYTVTVFRPSGEVLGRSNGEHRFGDEIFTFQDPKNMGADFTTELLIAQGVGAIVDYAQVLHHVPADAIARWASRPAIEVVLNDNVETDYSAAGSVDFEEMLIEELRTAGYRLGGGGDALILEVEIVKYEPGSRAKRLSMPGWGASRLAYEATVLDASGSVLGRTEGQKRYTGFELTDNPELKNDRQLRVDMADHCAAQISKFVQALPVAAASPISAAP